MPAAAHRAARGPAARAGRRHRLSAWAPRKRASFLTDSASSISGLKNRRQVRFDLRPRHAGSQHSQRVAKVNHGVKPGAEKIGGCHREHSLPNSQKLMQIGPVSGSSDHRHSP
jgi:hypothetical protein